MTVSPTAAESMPAWIVGASSGTCHVRGGGSTLTCTVAVSTPLTQSPTTYLNVSAPTKPG